MLQTERGFTLIETLFALSILSVILLLIPKHQIEQIDKLESRHFLDTLEMDVLYIQNKRSTQESGKSYILRFYPDNYSILFNYSTEIRREYPPLFSLDTPFPKDIEFSVGGVIKNPQSILISFGEERYRIVFPFGKGRFYVEER
ncbi:competence type IV pilus minor pilin ComGD [Oceanobacillus sp. FSL W8-0428]|uniref:Competence protein ComG n=1 Tax=Oceanobacillus sojae TaxID=582851 RepID=A0A511ZIW8_9BACI|nr:competence type IV pilus minor pilin ComGD [Oceanobacillus sojae]GEN87393.1 hypothetical protein OSO01_21320 [Oceanobacillus sojae]